MQSSTLEIPEEFNLALLGGRGGGKTIIALLLGIRHAGTYADKASVLVVRRTLRSLSDFEEEMLTIIESITGGNYQYNRAEKILRFNGASITLAAIEDRRSYDKLQGKSFTYAIFEEVTQFASEKLLRLIRSNLRGPKGVPTRVIYLGNPGGPLHGLIFNRHIKDRVPYQPYQLKLEGGDYEEWVTVPSTYLDNPFINTDEYCRRLREATHGNTALASQWIEGLWEEGAGLLFPAWNPDVHLQPLPENFRVDVEAWRPRIAIDWGLSSPSISLVGIRNLRPFNFGRRIVPAGSLWVLQEVTDAIMNDETDLSRSREWAPNRLGETIVNRAADLGIQRPIGVADSARSFQGTELIEELRTCGFWSLTKPRKGSRAEGWALVSSMLQAAIDDDPVRPHLYIAPTCHYLVATISTAIRSEANPDDWEDSPSCPDHAGDALRYLIAEQRVSPVTSGRTIGMY